MSELWSFLLKASPGYWESTLACSKRNWRVHPDIFVDARTPTSQIEESLVRERLLAHLSGWVLSQCRSLVSGSMG